MTAVLICRLQSELHLQIKQESVVGRMQCFAGLVSTDLQHVDPINTKLWSGSLISSHYLAVIEWGQVLSGPCHGACGLSGVDLTECTRCRDILGTYLPYLEF